MFADYCDKFRLNLNGKAYFSDIQRLTNITPGDFAAINRRHRFSPFKSVQEVVAALEDECGLKEGSQRAIGFV